MMNQRIKAMKRFALAEFEDAHLPSTEKMCFTTGFNMGWEAAKKKKKVTR